MRKQDVSEKRKLMSEEADYWYEGEGARWPIGIKYHAILLAAGVDDSNIEREFLVLLPENVFEEATNIRNYLQKRFSIQNVGVIITDSHTMPMRYGTIGVGLSWAGIEPVHHQEGEKDLFGETLHITRTNVIDSLAVAGVFVKGEAREQTPIAIISDIGNKIEFTNKETCVDDLLVDPKEDIYWALLRKIIEK